jgi:hypothetical protein
MRVHKTNNFTVMSNFHFKEKKMSLKAKGLLSLMLSLPDDWDYSISGLAALSKDGKDSVMSALGELEKFGYLTRARLTNDKGQFAGVEYNIYEQPQPKKPIAENPNSANENEGKPNAGNPSQLNTNLINNLFNELFMLLNTKDDSLVELYKEYIIMRDNIKSPLTPIGLKKLVERCEKLSNSNIKIQKLLLENAIINNWKNVYLPNESEIEKVNKDTQADLRALFGLEDE